MDVVLQQTSALFSVEPDPNSPVLLKTAEMLLAKDFQELIAEVRQLQQRRIRMVSVRRQRALQIGPKTLKEVLDDAGMEVCTLGFSGGFTGTLGRSYRQAVDDTRRALEYAAQLNARAVVVLPGSRGLHTYTHAERTIREGLNDCLDDALRLRIDMLLPLNSMLGSRQDVFHPRNIACLEWIQSLDSHRIRPMMMLRGGAPWSHLPAGWQRCLSMGGALRASGRTRRTLGRHGIVTELLAGLDNVVVPVS